MEPLTLDHMPLFKSHKIVRAAKVTGFELQTSDQTIVLATDYGAHPLRYNPGTDYQIGGYLVGYDDGYFSYSPAVPFEAGYTLYDPNAVAESLVQEPIGRYFAYMHLPAHLQAASQPFAELAALIITSIPRNAERTVALRKLLEAKDAAVRAAMPNQ